MILSPTSGVQVNQILRYYQNIGFFKELVFLNTHRVAFFLGYLCVSDKVDICFGIKLKKNLDKTFFPKQGICMI
jgi:hypothetical protein